MFKKLFILILFYSSVILKAQQPIPANKQTNTICLRGALIHIGNGLVIENGDVVFKDGKITYVGKAQSDDDIKNYEIVNCFGKEIYPGFIAPNSTLGLSEIEAVRATNDYFEVGQNNANTRALIAFYTDSKIIPTVRTNGVLMAQVTPRGGLFSGSSSVVHLDAWNWEDAIIKADDGLHLNWPKTSNTSYIEDKESASNEKNKSYEKSVQSIINFLIDVKAYGLSKPDAVNLRLEAAQGLLNGNKILYIHTNEQKEIIDAISTTKKYGIKKVVLVGARKAYLVADFIKKNNVSVMIERPHSLPSSPDADIDLPFKMASILCKEGILFCIQNEGDMAEMNTRNLPFLAGTCVAYGLNKEAAISALTLSTAKILGIDNVCGSIEVGKDATIFVSSGDALDIKTNQVEHAFIQGRKIQLTNEQMLLNEKYKTKYGIK